ncbi:MAG: ParB/RepB/Spo0J family partition protein [Halanaerobium sp.]|nr:ParB/RepB/Spo0J family partition protein [Halanaerobium sp.]
MPKKRLGRGLNVLIPGEGAAEESVQQIPVKKIEPNPYQPRKEFDEDSLSELTASIKKHGVIQPVLVRKKEDSFQLIAGERRWRASQAAGREMIPAMVLEADERKVMEIALVENLQREDLNILEKAKAYQQLLEDFSLTQDELAARVGKSRSAITNTLRLLKLPPEVLKYVSRETLSMGHARALLSLDDRQMQIALARKIAQEDLSVREVEQLVKAVKENNVGELEEETGKEDKEPAGKPEFFLEAEQHLEKTLGTRVKIKPGKRSNTLLIKFKDKGQLDKILTLLES